MSSSKSQAHRPGPQNVDDDLQPQQMTRRKRLFLIGVAVFCLLIFSVTGPMLAVFDNLFGSGPATVATAQTDHGEISITQQDLQNSVRLIQWEQRLQLGARSDEEDEVLIYTLMVKLADQLELVVPNQDVARRVQQMLGSTSESDYRLMVRNLGFNNILSFESTVRDVMRVPMLENLLASAQIPNQDDVIELFQDRYQEFQAEYIAWDADDFAAAAQGLEPTEEELATFFDEGLDFSQRRDLENEEAVAFEAIVLSAEALETEAVQAWATGEEPTEEELNAFYEFNKRFLYERPAPAEGEETPAVVTEPYLSREEIGDRLAVDFKMQRAVLALLAGASEAEDLAAFSAEKGVELITHADAVVRSQMSDLPRIGTDQLGVLFRADAGTWHGRAILVDGLAFLVRPTEIRQRELPPLAEVRESVIDYWRMEQQPKLATDAAEAFLAKFPQPEVEGDPILVDADGFQEMVAADSLAAQTLGWISKTRRPTTDPVWAPDDKLGDWLRGQIGRQLDDYSEGELIGPFTYQLATSNYIVVSRLIGTRDADASKIWPGELASLQNSASFAAFNKFREDQLSFPAMVANYQLQRVVSEESDGL
jgi:hypothetical protein